MVALVVTALERVCVLALVVAVLVVLNIIAEV